MEPIDKQRIATAAAALVLGLAAVGPWLTVLGGVFSVGPTNSTELSLVVFGGVAVLLLSALVARYMRPVTVLAGVAVLAETIHIIVRIQQYKDAHPQWATLVSPGWGLYLAVLVGLFLIASTWIVRQQPRGDMALSATPGTDGR